MLSNRDILGLRKSIDIYREADDRHKYILRLSGPDFSPDHRQFMPVDQVEQILDRLMARSDSSRFTGLRIEFAPDNPPTHDFLSAVIAQMSTGHGQLGEDWHLYVMNEPDPQSNIETLILFGLPAI